MLQGSSKHFSWCFDRWWLLFAASVKVCVRVLNLWKCVATGSRWCASARFRRLMWWQMQLTLVRWGCDGSKPHRSEESEGEKSDHDDVIKVRIPLNSTGGDVTLVMLTETHTQVDYIEILLQTYWSPDKHCLRLHIFNPDVQQENAMESASLWVYKWSRAVKRLHYTVVYCGEAAGGHR